MKKDEPIIHLLGERTNPDGTVDLDIEITDEFIEKYKSITGKKRATRRGIQEFLTKLVEDSVSNLK